MCKPSVYASEIQLRLLLDGISPPSYVPSQSGIKNCLREDCIRTRKKVSQVPPEELSQTITEYTDCFLDQVGQWQYTKLHFFDESSVIVTRGSRVYGNSYISQTAIEFQRYAWNANYTLNLLHSFHGVDYFDILRGSSNGMELLNFFNEALSVNRDDGSTILENSDIVITDNCGFHHRHFVEPLLQDMPQEHGVDLLYQPAYSPHLNTCEFCFHQIKCYLKQNSSLTANETDIAIGEGVSKKSAANSFAYFRKCGYI